MSLVQEPMRVKSRIASANTFPDFTETYLPNPGGIGAESDTLKLSIAPVFSR